MYYIQLPSIYPNVVAKYYSFENITLQLIQSEMFIAFYIYKKEKFIQAIVNI